MSSCLITFVGLIYYTLKFYTIKIRK